MVFVDSIREILYLVFAIAFFLMVVVYFISEWVKSLLAKAKKKNI
jgi:Na+-transporting methylmalonyl-CoA/oxaloacetate decarboxylase gamma subunit